jgi:hypothetical protein
LDSLAHTGKADAIIALCDFESITVITEFQTNFFCVGG